MPRTTNFAAATVLAGCLAGTLAAQIPATLPAAPPATSPATTPSASQPATLPATQPTAPISLDFKNVPLDAVLEHLSEAAGFVVIKDAPVEGRVTVVSRQPVSADEAVTLLNTVLKANGYTVIRNGRVLKVTGRDAAKKSDLPVHFGADPESIEVSDALITQVIPIGNVDAVKLRQDLAPLIGTEADVAANGGSNAIVITDTSSNVRRVVQIIAALDRHEPGNAELHRYTLKHADALATSKLILALLKPADQVPGQSPKLQTAEMALRGRINAVADERTNTLFVTAQADSLKTVDEVIKDLESNESVASEIRIFSLKFADAASASRLIGAVFRPEEQREPRGESPRREGADAALRARVIAAADDRTNTLVVTAPASTLKIIDEVLKKLDSDPATTTEIKVFPLTFADATSAAQLITTVFRPPPVQVSSSSSSSSSRTRELIDDALSARITAAADSRTNSLVITAPPESLKIIEQLLKALDANPAANSIVRVFQLKNADASSAVAMLHTIFDADPSTGVAAPLPAGVPPVTLSATRGKLTAASDSRTNTIIVQAPIETLTAVEAVLKELDSNPVTEETLFIYRLKNGQAAKMENVLNILFGNVQPNNSQNGNRFGNQNDPRNQGGRTTGNRSLTGSRNGRGSTQFDPIGQGFGGQAGGFPFNRGQNQNLPGNLSQGSMRAITELTGKVFVVADDDTNSLLITTATKYQGQVKQIVAELDRPAPQVLIKVLVAEVTHDNGTDVGVDFSILNQRANGNGQIGSTNFGLTGPNAATGGLVVQLLESNVNATLRALATAGKLEVLSRPYILASDNQLASITVGNEVPFITNTRITDQGQQINTIEYQDVGIILNVTPHISPDGLVIMDVIPEISQLTNSTVPISPGVTAPVIAKRSASSRVGIRTGNTIVIGGLMEDRKTESVSKVPLLGDIPLLGQIFSRVQINKTKTELLIFLTPHVAQQPSDLEGMSGQEIEKTKLTPKAIVPGMFDQHLDGMKTGEVPQSQPATKPDLTVLEVPMRPTYQQPATKPATP
ncbi:secretin N-terminal domain-containing protein [Humisphaera borealis]|uniref:Type II secretion system protein GspD n=1 Tax=Humisphaera borealis TaxID=2807512 RepID=A0A7M2WTG9_9BACT|nr:secretin N-terminal domain-containing protein [Humisphaera borealis]QOV88111.1 hypothetical protein IPV69_17840 [Humisphaera borealis]